MKTPESEKCMGGYLDICSFWRLRQAKRVVSCPTKPQLHLVFYLTQQVYKCWEAWFPRKFPSRLTASWKIRSFSTLTAPLTPSFLVPTGTTSIWYSTYPSSFSQAYYLIYHVACLLSLAGYIKRPSWWSLSVIYSETQIRKRPEKEFVSASLPRKLSTMRNRDDSFTIILTSPFVTYGSDRCEAHMSIVSSK